MKKTLTVFVIAVMSLSCGQGTDGNVIRIDESSKVIDVRTPGEYEAGHLRNAINIPYTEIGDEIAKHVEDKDEEIIVYCRSGRRSGIAKKILLEKGYKHVVNAGAYAKLKRNENKPQEREEASK